MVSSVKTPAKAPTKSALKTSTKAAQPTKAVKVQDKVAEKKVAEKKAAEKRKTPETIDSEDEERGKKKKQKKAAAAAPEESESEKSASEAEDNGEEDAKAKVKKSKPKVNRPLPDISFSDLAKSESVAVAVLSNKEESLESAKEAKKFPGLPIPEILVPYFDPDGNYFLISDSMKSKQRERVEKLNSMIETVREGGIEEARNEVRGTVGRVVYKCLQHLDKENNLGLSYDEPFTDKDGNEKMRERLIIRCKRSAIDTTSDLLSSFIMMLIHSGKQCAAAGKRKKLMPGDIELAVNANPAFNNIINSGKVNRFRKATASSGWLVGQARSRHYVSRINKEKKLKAEIKAREANEIPLNKTLQNLKENGFRSDEFKNKVKQINEHSFD